MRNFSWDLTQFKRVLTPIIADPGYSLLILILLVYYPGGRVVSYNPVQLTNQGTKLIKYNLHCRAGLIRLSKV